jgi:hypothetical protein
MHRFVMLGAFALVLCAALTGCGAVDGFFGLWQAEVPVMEQAIDAESGQPLFDAAGKPIMRPVLDEDGKPVVRMEWRRSDSSAASWIGTLLGGSGTVGAAAAAILASLGAFWVNLRKKKSDVVAVEMFDRFKAVVAGIVSLVDGKEGHTFRKEDLYEAIDSAAKLYTDNSDEFRALVAQLKAQIRGQAAADAS